MIQIKLPNQLPPEIEAWKVKAEEITALILAENDLVEQHRLIEANKKHWKDHDLTRWLLWLSSDKCWYTETKFGGDYPELEHFRPKRETRERDGKLHATHPGYFWLAFDLGNYRLCKSRPNRKKGAFFPILDERNRACGAQHSCADESPLFLDPLDEEDCLLMSFDDNGKPVPAIGIEEQDVFRVEFTIEKYYLDEDVLNRRREETWQTARLLFNKYLTASKAAKAADRDIVSLRNQAKKDLEALKSMLKSDKEFSSVAKASLIKTNDQSAISITAHS